MTGRANWIALFLALAAVLASFGVAEAVYERLPHVEDEMSYFWQARVYARGQIAVPSPEQPEHFFIPFVVDYHGLRFSKYPPGWPLLLALGLILKIEAWINPLLAGLGVWFTYRLGQKIFDDRTALTAGLLMTLSPFYLMVSGSLLSHNLSLLLCLGLTRDSASGRSH
jgi:hypothetical protein